jgi:hypothetical protein
MKKTNDNYNPLFGTDFAAVCTDKEKARGIRPLCCDRCGGSTTNFGQLNNTAISDSQPFT